MKYDVLHFGQGFADIRASLERRYPQIREDAKRIERECKRLAKDELERSKNDT